MTLRDIVVAGGAALFEPSSLPAFWRAAKCLPRALRQRREIMARRREDDEALAQWFGFKPAAVPIGELPPLQPQRIDARPAEAST
jgi:hypothetical protein